MSEPKTPYIGSKISLISKLDIRYEGILYSVNSVDSTIALSKVRSFGTEDRSAQLVPARDEVYEFIIFKATDIKDIVVCEPPKPSSGSAYDPAILSVSAVEPKEPSTASSNSPHKPQNPTFNQTGQQSSFLTNNQLSGGFGRSRRVNDSVTSDGNTRSHPKENLGNQENGNANANKYQRQNEQGRFQQQTYYNRNNNDYSNNEHRSTRGHNSNVGENVNRSQRNNRFYHNNNNNQEHNTQYQQNVRNNLKFDSDFDFERANEKFMEQLCAVTSDFLKTNIKGEENEAPIINNDSSTKIGETFYNKKTSFFDSISCEALEKNEGKNTRPDWKKERMTNQETFGHSAVRSLAYRRGSRGGFTNNGGQNRSNFQHQQQHYNVNNFHRNNYRHNQQQQSHQRSNYNRGGGRHQSTNFGNGNYNNQRQGGNSYNYHSQNRRQFQQNSEH